MAKLLYCFLLLWFPLSGSIGKVKLQDIKVKKLNADWGRMEIILDKFSEEIPQLKIFGRNVELLMPGVLSSSEIVKKISLRKKFDTTMIGRQVSKNVSKAVLVFPNSISHIKERINVEMKGKKVYLNFPIPKKQLRSSSRVPKKGVARKTFKQQKGSPKDSYDEGYLQKLLNEKKRHKNNDISINRVPTLPLDSIRKKGGDAVQTKVSSQAKGGNPFSFLTQIGKFASFLVLVIFIFYGLVLLIKKNIFNKGKLGFLNSTKIVEVLNTTYISPKRNVMLIKAHNQVFLIGSSEKGLHPLGEINDINGLLKKGERELSGNNFDTTLNSAATENKEFNLKKMLEQTSEEEKKEPSKIEDEVKTVKDKVKLSDQIRSKVKGLKSLQ